MDMIATDTQAKKSNNEAIMEETPSRQKYYVDHVIWIHKGETVSDFRKKVISYYLTIIAGSDFTSTHIQLPDLSTDSLEKSSVNFVWMIKIDHTLIHIYCNII